MLMKCNQIFCFSAIIALYFTAVIMLTILFQTDTFFSFLDNFIISFYF